MEHPFIVLIVLFAKCLLMAHSQCNYYDLTTPEISESYSCNIYIFTATVDAPNFPKTGGRQLTGTFNFQLIDLCGKSSGAIIYEIYAFTGTQYKRVFEINALSLNSFEGYAIDSTGIKQFVSNITTTSWVSGSIAIDLEIGTIKLLWMSPDNYIYDSVTNQNFGNWSWKITNRAPYMMQFVMDGFNYKNQFFTFRPLFEPYLFPLVLGTPNPILRASYEMFDKSGYSLNDSTEITGKAYFGASTDLTFDSKYSPTWTFMSGVKFKHSQQYISFPPTKMFQPGNLPLLDLTMALNFKIKLDSISSSTSPIFTRKSASSQVVWGIYLDSTGRIQTLMNNTLLSTSHTSLKPGTWHQVHVFFVYTQGRATSSISIDNVIDTQTMDTNPLIPLSSFIEGENDTVRAGGFIGNMHSLRIYGPGSPYVSTTTCSDSCAVDTGIRPSSCITPTCNESEYLKGFTCYPCKPTCPLCKKLNDN